MVCVDADQRPLCLSPPTWMPARSMTTYEQKGLAPLPGLYVRLLTPRGDGHDHWVTHSINADSQQHTKTTAVYQYKNWAPSLCSAKYTATIYATSVRFFSRNCWWYVAAAKHREVSQRSGSCRCAPYQPGARGTDEHHQGRTTTLCATLWTSWYGNASENGEDL